MRFKGIACRTEETQQSMLSEAFLIFSHLSYNGLILMYSFSNARASHGKAIVTLLVTPNLHFARRKPGAPGPHAQFISVPKLAS